MSEPERLLEAGGMLARRLLESGTAEHPSSHSLERTMATLAERDRLQPRTWSQRIMHSTILLKRRKRQWPLLALLATASFLMSVVVSYHWHAKDDSVAPAQASDRQSASVDWLERAR